MVFKCHYISLKWVIIAIEFKKIMEKIHFSSWRTRMLLKLKTREIRIHFNERILEYYFILIKKSHKLQTY